MPRHASHRRRLVRAAAALALLGLALPAFAAPAPPPVVKPRAVILTDVLNEPDDTQSLVRALLYSNEIDLVGLVATTSTWQKAAVHPEEIRRVIAGYGQALPNLRVHAAGYPDADKLLSVVRAGRADYGLAGVGEGKDTEASRLIIDAVDAADDRPLWICVWGGAVDLAQALYHVEKTRSPEQVAAFVGKLRVYSISDQDDAGPWVRARFPQLFWIASIHAFSDYPQAAWQGMSADSVFPDPGPDTRLMSPAWLDEHIRQGPLGGLYPKPLFAIEGDSPSFLYLIPNGLNVTEHPEYGGWGGRYGAVSARLGLYADTQDTAVGADGKTHTSNRVGIWRWREASQNDFANRIQWTLAGDPKTANHPPRVVLQGDRGLAPLELTVRYGEKIRLDATGTTDPDGDALRYRWWWYRDPSPPLFPMTPPDIASPDAVATDIVLPNAQPVPGEKVYHLVLEVRDRPKAGGLSFVRYRRAVVHVLPK
ncbi:hypothetical protein DMC25_19605 [Caulobacter sp. D4A]|uniref:nucleoside hydrolase-like domain-containing protein n=1 Tax=unclassified Caulobacter TaxID=2648921 RepID=UPI000D73C51B|nr:MULTISPECIES: nucleoside hydrolase-like domain-containing protein [unclassified Caulobacter]PXA82660.1 hypothetical protein DMC25_19605 [Caulobacter sp. D4A]PXA96070.1 hypothetical protein DMC18_02490 [Caulobacter sp. D5]